MPVSWHRIDRAKRRWELLNIRRHEATYPIFIKIGCFKSAIKSLDGKSTVTKDHIIDSIEPGWSDALPDLQAVMQSLPSEFPPSSAQPVLQGRLDCLQTQMEHADILYPFDEVDQAHKKWQRLLERATFWRI